MAKEKEKVKDSNFWEVGGPVTFLLLCVVAFGGCIHSCNKQEAEVAANDKKAVQEELAQMHIHADRREAEMNKEFKFYTSAHQLRKMFIDTHNVTEKTPAHASFFLFSANYEGTSEKTTVVNEVKFAWNIQNGTYIISTVSLDDVRIKVVERTQNPTVSFDLTVPSVQWCGDRHGDAGWACLDVYSDKNFGLLHDHMNPNPVIENFLNYVLITVSSQDWPTDVNLPMNRAKK